MQQLGKSKRRGCPTCEGVDARSCMRCHGKTDMRDWWNTQTGWAHISELTDDERQQTLPPQVSLCADIDAAIAKATGEQT